MIEYGKFIAIISLCFAIFSIISYKLSDKGVRMGLAVVFLGAAVSPIFAFLGDVGSVDFEIPNIEGESAFEERLREAYEDGMEKGIAEVLMTDPDRVCCSVDGFNLKDVSAKRITVTLSGIAVVSDTDRLNDFLSEMGFEDWEVVFKLDGN